MCTSLTCVPIETKRRPRNIVDAQFSTPYTVAVALLDRKVTIDSFTEPAIRRQDVLALAQKVRPELDEAVPGGRLEAGAEVEVIMTNGEVYRGAVERPKGTPENPMTEKDFVDKLRDCAEHAAKEIPMAKLEELASAVRKLEEINDISKLVSLVV